VIIYATEPGSAWVILSNISCNEVSDKPSDQ
jgi:hypothetical protein